jgi:plastocyanin
MLPRASLALLIMLAACSSSNSKAPDAAPPIDAAPPTVMAVTCPGGTVPTVTTDDNTFAFTPSSTTISLGQIVKFTTSLTHNVVPNPTASDPGLVVDFNKTKCLQFTHAGTFGFHCAPHGFAGTITVQ